jgi:hypothetical protein
MWSPKEADLVVHKNAASSKRGLWVKSRFVSLLYSCLLDTEPREGFSSQDQELLLALSQLVVMVRSSFPPQPAQRGHEHGVSWHPPYLCAARLPVCWWITRGTLAATSDSIIEHLRERSERPAACETNKLRRECPYEHAVFGSQQRR